jgi:hypothetical protein
MDPELYYGLIKFLLNQEVPEEVPLPIKSVIIKIAPSFILINNQLVKINNQPHLLKTTKHRIVILSHQKHQLLKQAHDQPLAGHQGQDNTYQRISQIYYWPGMKNDIQEYVKTCQKCQKRQRRTGSAPLNPIQKHPQPFYQVGIDVMGPLPRTPTGKRYIVVAIDHFSKWVEAKALEEADAQEITQFIYEDIICRHGVPNILTSDRGTEFVNELIAALTRTYKIHHIKTTAYHPEGNGQTERTNRTIKDILSKITPQAIGNWSHYLSSAVFVTRVTKQGSTNFSPSEILFGHQIRQHFEPERYNHQTQDPEDYLLQEVSRIQEIRQQASKFIKKAQDRQKEYHDSHKHLTEPLKIGDLVLIYRNVVEANWSAKMEPKWEGPFYIQDIKETTYSLRTLQGTILLKKFHRNRIKIYHGRHPIRKQPVIEVPTRNRH